MPCINVKVEGTTKMIKSVLVNVEDVCQAIGRPIDCELGVLFAALPVHDCSGGPLTCRPPLITRRGS